MQDVLIKYVNEQISSGHEEKIDAQDDLLGGGILDSLGMMKLVLFIENEFNIKVPPEDMTIENFMSIETIVDYIANN